MKNFSVGRISYRIFTIFFFWRLKISTRRNVPQKWSTLFFKHETHIFNIRYQHLFKKLRHPKSFHSVSKILRNLKTVLKNFRGYFKYIENMVFWIAEFICGVISSVIYTNLIYKETSDKFKCAHCIFEFFMGQSLLDHYG